MEFQKVSFLWLILVTKESIGFLLSLIGYGGNYIVSVKADGKYRHFGLWTMCYAYINCYDTADWVESFGFSRVWVDASRGMMSIAIICQFLVILLTAMGLFRTATRYSALLITGVAVVSVVNGLIGLSIAAGKGISLLDNFFVFFNHGVDWSFTLFLIGQFAFIGAALGHYWDSRRLSTSPTASCVVLDCQGA